MNPNLLWRAWPEGYLAMRGVLTVADWHCWGLIPWGSRSYAAPVWVSPDGVFFDGDLNGDPENPFDHSGDGYASTNFRQAVEAGDLLPNVDPADTATWACLKLDLGCAAKPQLAAEDWTERDSLFWSRNWSARDAGLGWVLGNCFGIIHFFPGIGTDNPAEALVLARIQLREAAQ